MQLLIVPVVLAIGGFIFNRTEKQLEHQRAQDRAALERKHADERVLLEQQRVEERARLEQQRAEETQREAALQTCLDQMADLLLNGLRTSEAGSEVRDIARIRTLTTLRRLDSARCSIVFRFLHDANLVNNTPESIINLKSANFTGQDLEGAYVGAVYLEDANLQGANLRGAYLEAANLRGVRLRGANLYRANLHGANLNGVDLGGVDLQGTDLYDANIHGANLRGANLLAASVTNEQLKTCVGLRGATLRDGTKVPDDVDYPFR